MRVLVTGGSGFIGSVLCPMLEDVGHRVTVLDSQKPLVNAEWTKASIADDLFPYRELSKSDVIVHLAGIVGYPACDADPERAWAVNVLATKNLADFARGEDKRIIYASTQSVYGASTEMCHEDSPVGPLTLYAATKASSEILLQNLNAFILRFATGFGVSPKPRHDLLINNFAKVAVETGSLDIYQPSMRRSFIHVKDIARAIRFAITRSDTTGVFNIGDESANLTKAAIAEMVAKASGCSLVHGEGEDKEKRDYFVSYEKIHELGFRTKYSVQSGIEELVRFYQG